MMTFTRRQPRILLATCLLTLALSIYNIVYPHCECYSRESAPSRQLWATDDDRPVNAPPTLAAAKPMALRSENEALSKVNVATPHQPSMRINFSRYMTAEEKHILFDLAAKFHSVCNLRNIQYFMYGGTLLGSYRHHDMIPWDDDIDVFVNVSQRAVLEAAFATLSPRYNITKVGPRNKFYSSRSIKKSRFWWKWPYIDVHFFTENGTHIRDASRDFRHYLYPKSVTFPLHLRPLGDMYLQSPFDAYATLALTYRDLDKCTTHYYSHKYEKLKNRASSKIQIPCVMLQNSVPFVHRSANSKGVRETLMKGKSIVHSIVVDEPRYAVVRPFTLDLP